MYPQGAQLQLPVQAVCSALSHLFLLVYLYVDRHKHLRQLRIDLVAETRLSLNSGSARREANKLLMELKQMHEKAANDRQRCKSQRCEFHQRCLACLGILSSRQ